MLLLEESSVREAVSYTLYVVVAALLAATAAWLCKTFARYAAGSGIPEIKTILGIPVSLSPRYPYIPVSSVAPYPCILRIPVSSVSL